MNRLRSVFAGLLALLSASPVLALASAPTTAPDDGGIAVVASGLTNPRGFTWGGDGTLYVAEAGSGGTTPATGEPAVPPPVGPYQGGRTGRVVWISAGCPAKTADGLPSAVSATGEDVGAAGVAILGGKLYTLIAGGGAAHGNPGTPNGVYEVSGDGITRLVADLGDWLRKNPVAKPPQTDYDPDGSFFDLVPAPDGSALWVVESNSQQVLSVTPDGTVTRLADLSGDNQVPTVVAPAPGGGIYVGYLSGAPYPDGTAKVVQIDPSGKATDVWTGLTMVTGLAIGPDGTLYASEMATGNTTQPPFFRSGTGKIVRQTGPGSAAEVATGLSLPVALALGPDGALYVAAPALGGAAGQGVIVRLDVAAGKVLSMAAATPPATPCASPVAGTGTATPAAATPVTEGTAVKIYDFGFDPPSITIKAGTKVTWTNTGQVQHTTVSFRKGKKVWDSDIMNPGATYTVTFDQPGSYDYVCGLHPSMQAHIEVTA